MKIKPTDLFPQLELFFSCHYTKTSSSPTCVGFVIIKKASHKLHEFILHKNHTNSAGCTTNCIYLIIKRYNLMLLKLIIPRLKPWAMLKNAICQKP